MLMFMPALNTNAASGGIMFVQPFSLHIALTTELLYLWFIDIQQTSNSRHHFLMNISEINDHTQTENTRRCDSRAGFANGNYIYFFLVRTYSMLFATIQSYFDLANLHLTYIHLGGSVSICISNFQLHVTLGFV